MDTHQPVPVTDLATLHSSGPTPAGEWLDDARLQELVMPAVAALVIIIAVLGITLTVLTVVIVGRLSS